MQRRSFLVGAVLAPSTLHANLPGPTSEGIRVSVDKDDPGYRNYCIANGDNKKVVVYLDGVEQRMCFMADESLGVVRRIVLTPNGNIAHDNGEAIFEEIKGDVRVVFLPK